MVCLVRCTALDTFEAMLASGCRPHAAVYSSIIDVLWQTGISWAQAKALHLFTTAVQCAPCSSWRHTTTPNTPFQPCPKDQSALHYGEAWGSRPT